MASTNLVFQFLLGDVLSTMHSFISTTSASMAAVVGGAGSIMFAIYVMLWGVAILRGSVQEPLSDGFSRILRGVFILAMATSAGIYSDWIVSFFWEVPGLLAAEVVKHSASSGLVTGSDNATALMLDTAFGAGLSAAQGAWQKGASVGIMSGSLIYYVISVLIVVFVAIVCALGGALVLMANMGLSIMLGLGPLFIIFAMFEATNQLFVAWTRQVITFAVFFVVLAAALSLTFSFFTPFVSSLAESQMTISDTSKIVTNFGILVVVCGAALFVLYQSTSWASGLAGGVSVAGAGAVNRMASAFAGGAVFGSRALAHREYDPGKQNRDGSRGGKVWRGAAPALARGASSVGTKGAAYMRRNQIKRV